MLKLFGYVHADLFAHGQVYHGGMLNYLGRMQSALFGILTILMIYLLASRLFGRRVGLFSAFFMTFAFHHIQTFALRDGGDAPDLLLLLVLYLCWRWIWDRGGQRWLDAVRIGLVTGAALATKFSAMTFLAPIGIAWLARLWEQWTGGAARAAPHAARTPGRGGARAGARLLRRADGYPVLKGFGYFTDIAQLQSGASGRAAWRLGRRAGPVVGPRAAYAAAGGRPRGGVEGLPRRPPRLVRVAAAGPCVEDDGPTPRRDRLRDAAGAPGPTRCAASWPALSPSSRLAVRYPLLVPALEPASAGRACALVVLLALYPSGLWRYLAFSERWLLLAARHSPGRAAVRIRAGAHAVHQPGEVEGEHPLRGQRGRRVPDQYVDWPANLPPPRLDDPAVRGDVPAAAVD